MPESYDVDIDLQLPETPLIDSNDVEAIKVALQEIHQAIFNLASIVAASRSDAKQAALTNSSGGTYDGTIQAVAGSGADAAINNNFTELYELTGALRTALVDAKIINGS